MLKFKWLKGSFASNVLTLMTTTALAQVIGFLAAPVLARLYSPTDYGELALFISILGGLTIISCWQYEMAIVLPEKDEDAANIFILSILITVAMSVLTLVVLFVVEEIYELAAGVSLMKSWLWLLPISLFLMGTYQSFKYWFTRKKQFRQTGSSQLSQAVVSSACQISIGTWMKSGPMGLVGGFLIGQLFANVLFLNKTLREDWSFIRCHMKWDSIRQQAKRFKKFPIYSALPALINNLSLSLPVFLFTNVFGSLTTGYYSFAMRIVNAPLLLISTAFAQVFLADLAKERNDRDKYAFIVEKALRRLIILSIPILILLEGSTAFFDVLFGAAWETSGEYIQILAIGITIRFIVSPITSVFIASEKQQLSAGWQIIHIVSTFTFLYVSFFFSAPKISLMFLVVNDILLYSSNLLLIRKVSNMKIRNIFNFKKEFIAIKQKSDSAIS